MVENIKETAEEKAAALYLKKLKEKLSYYKQVVVDSNDAVIIQDFNGVVKAWNKGATRIYGFEEKEMLGKNITRIIAKENQKDALKSIKSIREGKPTFKINQTRITKDKNKISVVITYSPIYEDEEIIEIGTTEEDISELIKSLKESEENEAKLKSIFNNTQIGIAIADFYHNILEVNPSFCKILGYSPEELKKMTFRNFTHPDDLKESKKLVGQLMAGKINSFEIEKRYLRKDKKIIWGEVKLTSIYDKSGKFLYNISSLEDITEKKKAEEEMIEDEEKFSKVFDVTANSVSISRISDGKFIDINKSAEKIFRYSRKEIIGKTSKQLRIWADHKEREKVLRELEKEGRIDYKEVLLRRKSGEIFPVLMSARKIEIENEPCLFISCQDVTKSKKIEEELKANEKKFKSLFDSMNEGVALHELVYNEKRIPINYKVIDVNPAYEKQTGISSKKARGNLATKVYDTKTPPYLDIYSRVAKTGKPEIIEIFFPPLKKYFKISTFSPSEDHFATVFEDITEKKKSEEIIKESEEKFSKAFNSNPLLMALSAQKDGRYIEVNESFIKTLKFNRKEVIGNTSKNLKIIVNPKDRKSFLEEFQAKGNLRNRETDIRAKDGTILRGSFSIDKIKILDKDYLLTIMEDVTERKKAEEKLKEYQENLEQIVEERTMSLKESEKSYRELIENMQQGIYISDGSGGFTKVNQAMQNIFGYSEKELLKMKAWDLAKPEIREEIKNGFFAKIKARNFSPMEVECVTKEGKNIFAEISIIEIMPRGISGLVTDITERKNIEAIRSQFFSNISHELRTPITPIKAQVQRMLERTFSPLEERDALMTVSRNIVRLDRLIQSLLEISRIQSGKLSLNIQKGRLSDMLREAVETMNPLAEEDKAMISLEIDQKQEADFDRDRMLEVVINLIDNSLKYGSSRVYISAKQEKKNILISIKDNGKGISKKDISHIFEPFFRGREFGGEVKGVGLGLAICKGIIEAHGGKIWAESTEGKGTTFYIEVPISHKI